jgi:hypothetical protein
MHPSREDISNASKLMRKWLDLHHQGHENSDAQEQLMKEVRVTLHKCPNLAPELNLPPCTDCYNDLKSLVACGECQGRNDCSHNAAFRVRKET